MAVTAATVIVISHQDPVFTVAGIAGQLAVAYLVAHRYPRWASAALAVPFAINAAWPFDGDDPGMPGVVLLVLVVAAEVLGDSGRQRGEVIAERDASHLAMEESLRDQAVMAERARIARELHDIVAHHISMISVQAERARMATPAMPEEGKARLVHWRADGPAQAAADVTTWLVTLVLALSASRSALVSVRVGEQTWTRFDSQLGAGSRWRSMMLSG